MFDACSHITKVLFVRLHRMALNSWICWARPQTRRQSRAINRLSLRSQILAYDIECPRPCRLQYNPTSRMPSALIQRHHNHTHTHTHAVRIQHSEKAQYGRLSVRHPGPQNGQKSNQTRECPLSVARIPDPLGRNMDIMSNVDKIVLLANINFAIALP